MMRMAARISLAAVVAFALAGLQAVCADSARTPVQLMRAAEAVEVRLIAGDASASSELTEALGAAAAALLALAPEAALAPDNVRAAFACALSGGDVRVLRRLLGLQGLLDADAKLAKGVLAYSEGRMKEAREELKDISARALPPSIAGRVALVQAIVHAKGELATAIKLLDDARLLAGSTLVEEAALRRQVALVASAKDFARFERSSAAYLSRFQQSAYAPRFSAQFAEGASQFDYERNSGMLVRLGALLDLVRATDRLNATLAVAERAVLSGNLALADFAADRATKLPGDAAAKARARLYGASAQAAGLGADTAVTALRDLPENQLQASDRALRSAALAVAGEVTKPTADVTGVHGPDSGSDRRGGGSGSGASHGKANEESGDDRDSVVQSAQRVLAIADKALRGKS